MTLSNNKIVEEKLLQVKRSSPRSYSPEERSTEFRIASAVFAENLSMQRKLRGWTQKKVAEESGLPQSVISNFESGWANPTLENLVILSKAFKLPPKTWFEKIC